MQIRGQDACRLGCRWFVTDGLSPLTADEPSPSYHNSSGAGFLAVAVRDNFGLPGTTG